MTNKLPIDSLVNTWNSLTGKVMKRLPIDQLTNTVLQWFSVSDSQVAEILEKSPSRITHHRGAVNR